MAKKGRKTKWETHIEPYLDVIEYWYSQGMTEKEICTRLDVSVNLWSRKKNEKKQLSEALTRARRKRFVVLSQAVENCAVGGKQKEIKKEVITVDDKGRTIKIVEAEKIIPPNFSALKYLLSKIEPEIWDEDYKGISSENEGDIILTNLKDLQVELDEIDE